MRELRQQDMKTENMKKEEKPQSQPEHETGPILVCVVFRPALVFGKRLPGACRDSHKDAQGPKAWQW